MTDGTPGWFRDPTDPTLARWHDGTRWTEHTLVIADQAPGIEPPPPEGLTAPLPPIGGETEPAFHIPRGRQGVGWGWPAWARFGAPVALVVLVLLAWVVTSSGDDSGDDTATVDTIPASLDDAVRAARRAGLVEEVSDERAAALIERICGATTRPAGIDQLGEDLGELPAATPTELRQNVGALGVGAAVRCRDDLEDAPDLIDELQDLAVAAQASTTTAPTVLPEGTDAGVDAGTDTGTGTGSGGGGSGGTTRTTRGGGTGTTAKPTTTTTLPEVLRNSGCSSEGARAQDSITGAPLTCTRSSVVNCTGSLKWRTGGVCTPTTTTTPPPASAPTVTQPSGTTSTTSMNSPFP